MVGDEQPPQSNAEPTDNNVAESKAPETSAPESVPTENAAQLAAPENVTATADNKAPEGVTTETKSSADAATENKAPEKAATNAVPEGEAPSTSAPENATPADTQPQDAPKPLSTDSPQDTKMENVPTPQESFPVTSEIRQPLTQPNATEAPSNDVVGAAPPIPTQPLDQEMPDAPQGPMSPTKMSREREPDQSEEPAAKRPKVEGEEPGPADVKVPELPTPTTEPPAESPMDKKPGMTKMQHKFLVKGIQSLKRMQHARFYREPVDPIKLNIPQYHQVITQPMDLGTIEKKLKNNEYPTPQGYIDDFNLMVQNSVTFNGPDHIVAQEALSLKSTFDKQMLKLPGPDEVEEKKPKKAPQKTSAARREPRTSAGQASRPAGGSPQATTFALSPEGLPLIRRDSTNTDGRPKRSIHPPKRDLPYSTKPKKKKYQWELRFCQETLDELHKSKHYSYAVPFYLPVDPVALNIPSYHSIVKNPMDLSTISSKLKAGQYEHAKEFEADMRLMLKNCFRFNIQGDPTYMAGQRLEEVFNNKWAGLKRYLEMHEPHPGHMSATSDEDGSEEDDDESDEYDESQAVNSLQKQMLDISRQLEAMTQKKKKTPPGSKKVGKSKSGKKDSKDSKKSRSSGTGKKDRKSKSSKAEKDRWVTYHEKQIISNGISSLPDKKMQEALKIIQSNVPSLKVGRSVGLSLGFVGV